MGMFKEGMTVRDLKKYLEDNKIPDNTLVRLWVSAEDDPNRIYLSGTAENIDHAWEETIITIFAKED